VIDGKKPVVLLKSDAVFLLVLRRKLAPVAAGVALKRGPDIVCSALRGLSRPYPMENKQTFLGISFQSESGEHLHFLESKNSCVTDQNLKFG